MEWVLSGIKWVKYKGALVPDVEPHMEVSISREDAEYLLKVSRAFFLRFTNDFDRTLREKFWYIIKDKSIDTEEFSSNTRNQIKKGDKLCEVVKVDAKFIGDNCFDIYENALRGYGVNPNNITRGFFKNIFKKDLESYDYWVVRCRSSQACIAYAVIIRGKEHVDYKAMKFDRRYLKMYPSYILIFKLTSYYLNDLGFKYVSDGSRSVSHETNIQNLLIKKFKFRKAYCNLNIFYRKDVYFLVKVIYPFKALIEMIPSNKFSDRLLVLLRHEQFSK